MASTNHNILAVGMDEGFPRLTVELRDGSRVVGQSVEEKMRFHSALLGDLKLSVGDIRSVEFTDTNAAKLTAANGDVLAVQPAEKEISIRTSFGKVELAVNTVRWVRVSPFGRCGQPFGLVALWSGEDSGNDSISGRPATLMDISFVDGQIGRAFSFNGTTSHIDIPDDPSLDVGASKGFTVMAWIKPTDVNGIYNVFEWNDYLCAFEIGQTPADYGVLLSSCFDSNRSNHFLRSESGALVANVFQHVAMTYDKASGMGVLYVNGSVAAQSQLGSYRPLTKGGIRIGYRPSKPGDWTYQRFFNGIMDEISVYNRALSADAIKSASER